MIRTIEIDGPEGPLAGTLLLPDDARALALILPGSGPTDRDGNGGPGLQTDAYRLLAEGLAEAGIATFRADKRGLFGSRHAISDPNAVRLTDYADDARAWIQRLRRETGQNDVWLIGHSEGALVALLAAGAAAGLLLVAAPGRPLGAILREQFSANPANEPILEDALAAINALEAGRFVAEETLPEPLRPLFAAGVQDFLIDAFQIDPAECLRATSTPCLILQGLEDIQVGRADAERLAAARPDATLSFLPGVNHVLKNVPKDDRAANIACYSDPSLPIAPEVVAQISRFMRPE